MHHIDLDPDEARGGAMNIEAYRHFVVLSQTLHFGRAAETLNMSQPPLSQSIKALETGLGVALFHRTRRSVEMTEEGRMLLPVAQRIVASLERARVTLSQRSQDSLSQLVVSLTGDAFMAAPAPFMTRLGTLGDVVRLENARDTAEQLARLAAKEIDLAIAYLPAALPASLNSVILSRHRVMAAVPRNDPLSFRKSISLSELPIRSNFQLPGDLPEAIRDALWSRIDGGGTKRHEQDRNSANLSTSTVLDLVAGGLARSVVNACWAEGIATGVTMREIEDLPDPILSLAIIWNRSNRNTFIPLLTREAALGAPTR